jgi:glycosyltransferase involved in cell wall biosynthesis
MMIHKATRGTLRETVGSSDTAGSRDRIRVLQFLSNFAIGGTERQVVNLARGLDPTRFEVHFGCLRQWGELLGDATESGISVAEYRITNLYNARAIRERLRLAQDLKRARIEVVHTYNFYGNVFAIPAARLAGVPVLVASIRGLDVDLTPLKRRAQRLVCRLAHRIVVNAEAVRQNLIADGYDPGKIVVIRNGIDLSRFRSLRGDGRLRQQLGLPPQAPLVATFARLIPLKGLEYFLEAAALVSQRVADARFLVVGDYLAKQNGEIVSDGTYRNELVQYAARLGLDGRVTFTGFRRDVPDLLSEIAVSVLPSVGEGLSNSILEAMAVGVPVVATDVGGNREAIQDGVTGFVVPPRDAPALARGICQFLEDGGLASRFASAGRQRVAEHFSLERMVRDTEGFYMNLVHQAVDRVVDPVGTA